MSAATRKKTNERSSSDARHFWWPWIWSRCSMIAVVSDRSLWPVNEAPWIHREPQKHAEKINRVSSMICSLLVRPPGLKPPGGHFFSSICPLVIWASSHHIGTCCCLQPLAEMCCITVKLSPSKISESVGHLLAAPCLSMFPMTISIRSSRSVRWLRE